MSVVVECGYCGVQAATAKTLAHEDDCSRFGAARQECRAEAWGFCDCPRHASSPEDTTEALR